jgi:hypothetical protein
MPDYLLLCSESESARMSRIEIYDAAKKVSSWPVDTIGNNGCKPQGAGRCCSRPTLAAEDVTSTMLYLSKFGRH